MPKKTRQTKTRKDREDELRRAIRRSRRIRLQQRRRSGRRSTIGDVMGMTPNKPDKTKDIGAAAADQAAMEALKSIILYL